MARQLKVTTFQIVNNGWAGVIYAKRDRWTARVVESRWEERPVGRIVDVLANASVTRCLTTAQKEQRRSSKREAAAA